MQITFCKIRESNDLELRSGGQTVGRISYSENHRRHYWYRLGDRDPDEGPHNTLSIPDSATTFEGCVAEVESYFANPVHRKQKAKSDEPIRARNLANHSIAG